MAPCDGAKKEGSDGLGLGQVWRAGRITPASGPKFWCLPGLVPTAEEEPGFCLLSCPSTPPRGECGPGDFMRWLTSCPWPNGGRLAYVSYLLQSSQTSVDQEGSGQSFGPFVTDLVLSQAVQGEGEEWLLQVCKSHCLFLNTRLVIQTSWFHQHREALDTGGDEVSPGVEVPSPGKPLSQVR